LFSNSCFFSSSSLSSILFFFLDSCSFSLGCGFLLVFDSRSFGSDSSSFLFFKPILCLFLNGCGFSYGSSDFCLLVEDNI
jgi:hypothetical protein